MEPAQTPSIEEIGMEIVRQLRSINASLESIAYQIGDKE